MVRTLIVELEMSFGRLVVAHDKPNGRSRSRGSVSSRPGGPRARTKPPTPDSAVVEGATLSSAARERIDAAQPSRR